MTDVRKDLPKKLDDVPGWLSYGDQLVFQWLLEWQSRTQEPSDLVEVGVYKGKSAIHLARNYGGRRRNFVGQHFWARGYFVSTVGRDEATVRAYIKNQEQEDRRLEQLEMFNRSQLPVGGPKHKTIRFERFTYYKPPALPGVSDYNNR